ncbi:3-hydroxyacyl-CoA dehydrogenase [Halalkalibacterium halodurans]|uniref:3-hydroxyacyl-CoA dehydrogenase n=1 Tax=Halalkalibacterium halodurans TaxID=86665 RepID=UPI000A73432D|nr:3-hydroxyacyl-CoA dehydrogenase [Halalkalibacterium halodurans]MDY7220712.1 3-hydroxyacyl-CoA dehydrogenase [Halalkalibacterium halodurans]MDY7239951.1 3-hydroxyacyl-CoA dehydrogenase [Halalkalibacterium halodurans]
MVVKQVTVVGAGVMGRGIAYVFALAGFQTTLTDISEEQLNRAQQYVEETAEKGVAKGKVTEEQKAAIVHGLNVTTHLKDAVKQADLIVEAVPEKRELKQAVLEVADEYSPPHAVIASNTSTISPTELGSYTKRSNQTAVMHFFNPVPRMPLVEIVKGLETSQQTVDTIREVSEQIGKETVEVNEFPGFVTSRISALIGNEALHMLQEGVASAEDIDKAVRLGLNFPMGPLELADLVGLDARLNNLRYLHETLGEKYRPAPLLEKLVKAGRLGRKTKQGIYKYD